MKNLINNLLDQHFNNKQRVESIIQSLQENDIWNDSICVFSGDNGAKNGCGDNSILRAKNRTVLEEDEIKRIRIYYR